MIDQIINLIGRNAKFLAILLIGLITVNVTAQFYTHKTTAFTAWKGGGFGMYTAPHADARSVWLEMDGQNGTVQLRVYPENKDLRIWIDGVSLRGGATLQDISTVAKKLRFYPNQSGNSDRFFRSGKSGQWKTELTSEQADKIRQNHNTVMKKHGYL